jgi:hypothetical protein
MVGTPTRLLHHFFTMLAPWSVVNVPTEPALGCHLLLLWISLGMTAHKQLLQATAHSCYSSAHPTLLLLLG